ncbi:MAG: Sjogren's syndrome/scleroderma autoantigen 1 family protein [Candidatus Thorarchaeota archaeon]
MNKSNDDGIKAIAEALQAGGTLLNAACPICNSPLIKINKQVFCKVCNREVIIYKDESELPKEIQKALKNETRTSSHSETQMEITLRKKLEFLRLKLEATDDPDEIIKLSEAVDKIHATLTKIESTYD